MSAYKNLEIYNLAFNLAMKVYKLNIMIPENLLLKFGNPLRRISFRIKDLIAEGHSAKNDEKQLVRSITFAETQTQEAISLLKKMKVGTVTDKQIEDLIRSYKQLKSQLGRYAEKVQKEKNEYIIPFPENKNFELV